MPKPRQKKETAMRFKKIIVFLLAGCSFQSEKEANKKVEISKNKEECINIAEEYYGTWVSEKYIEALKKTKSTKKAGELGVDEFYKITPENVIIKMNIHEGGDRNIILMTAKDKGIIYSMDTSSFYSNVEFTGGKMIVNGVNYIKAPNSENGLTALVDSVLISGEYWLDSNKVEIMPNGTVIGVNNLRSLELNLDYNDAGMQLDKLYLKFSEDGTEVPYIYEIKNDTLFIFELECMTVEDDYCVEIEKGREVYRFIKKVGP